MYVVVVVVVCDKDGVRWRGIGLTCTDRSNMRVRACVRAFVCAFVCACVCVRVCVCVCVCVCV